MVTLKLPQAGDLADVIREGLCIGCGACTAADPSLRLVFDARKQMYQPSGPGGAAAATVCPAVGVDFAGLERAVFGAAPSTPLGVIESVLLAQSTDHGRNLRASSGGLIKELLIALLGKPEVDGAIVLAHGTGLAFEPRLITRPEEVDRLPGSIYHAVSFEAALPLLQAHPGRYVLVASPCQLEGIYTYIFRCRPELAERIHTTIGLICGWQYTHHALRALCAFKGVDFDAIQDIAYRGGGPVGKLRITTPQGETVVNRRVNFGYQVAFDRSFNIRRCHLCVNHTNVLAHIVVGDAWLPSTVATATGVSIVICRTASGAALLREMQAAGRVRIAEVGAEDVVESQTPRVAHGDFAYAFAEYLRSAGRFCPEMEGPNRPAAQLAPREEVVAFDRALTKKLRLQHERRYRQLYWRKLTVELGPLLYRYVRWFFVRVLKIKSLLGLRKEVPREKLAEFI